MGSIIEQWKRKRPDLWEEQPEVPGDSERREREERVRRQAEQRREREDAWERLAGQRGRRYSQCTLDGFAVTGDKQRNVVASLREYADSMRERVNGGESIVFFGPPGTGKDHLMAAMIREAIVNHGLRCLWKNGMDLYGEVRDRIGDDRDEGSLIAAMAAPDILAISDPVPPFGEVSQFQASTMFRIIDKRYSAMKPTWVTLNVAKGVEAETRLGAAVVDRLRHGAWSIHCDWQSYRKGAS